MKLDHKNKLIIQDYINSNNIEFVSTPNSAFEIYKNLQYCGTQICNSLSVSDRIFVIKKQIDFIQKSIVNILYESNDLSAKNLKCGYVYAIQNPAWNNFIKVGCAIDVYDRLNSYQTSTPLRDYTIIDYVYSDDRFLLESKVHSLYDRNYEWVKATPEDIKKTLRSYRIYPEIKILEFALREAINQFVYSHHILPSDSIKVIIKKILRHFSSQFEKIFNIDKSVINLEAAKSNSICFNKTKSLAIFKFLNLEFTITGKNISLN